jgi:hypothetical protein
MCLPRLVVLALPATLLGCSSPKPDARTRDILAGATKVEVFRLDGKWEGEVGVKGGASPEFIGRFPVTARGADQGPEFAAELAAVLADPTVYSGPFAKCYWPGVAFRVWKGGEAADVLVCFLCHNLGWGPVAAPEAGRGSFWGSPRTGDLVRLAKKAFPDDPEVQGLKEESAETSPR